MTAWKNILTDPPGLHKTSFGLWSDTVLATDGKDVFIGNIAKETGDLFFTGRSADCYECEELRSTEYDLTGWQWMPTAAPEREKTADEMFRELGYLKRNLSDADVTQYDNTFLPYSIRFINGAVYKLHEGYGKGGFTQDEILACAEWIEERRPNELE